MFIQGFLLLAQIVTTPASSVSLLISLSDERACRCHYLPLKHLKFPTGLSKSSPKEGSLYVSIHTLIFHISYRIRNYADKSQINPRNRCCWMLQTAKIDSSPIEQIYRSAGPGCTELFNLLSALADVHNHLALSSHLLHVHSLFR